MARIFGRDEVGRAERRARACAQIGEVSDRRCDDVEPTCGFLHYTSLRPRHRRRRLERASCPRAKGRTTRCLTPGVFCDAVRRRSFFLRDVLSCRRPRSRSPTRARAGAAQPAPPARTVAALLPSQPSPASGPGHVALIMPISGKLSSAGISLREGFMTAYYQTPAPQRLHVRFYDTAELGLAAAVSQATRDGAELIVGPPRARCRGGRRVDHGLAPTHSCVELPARRDSCAGGFLSVCALPGG